MTDSAPKTGRPAWHSFLAWAKIVVSIGLLWFLFTRYDFAEAASRLVTINPVWLAVTAVLYGIMVFLATARWRVILKALGESIALSPAVGIVMIGLFFNQILPSNMGGDAMRIWRLHRLGSRLGRAVGSVMLDRVIAIVALAILVLVMLPASMRMIDDPVILGVFGAFIAAVFAGLGFLLWLDRLMFFARRILPGRIIDAVSALAHDSRTVLLNRVNGAGVLFLAFANHLLLVLLTMALARGLGIPAGFTDFLVLIPPVLAASVLPLSLAGWGVREGAMIALLGTIGIGANEALSLSVAVGLVALAGSLPGGVVWLATGNRAGR
jgi:uncharacterized protein (TIRG00374 family)